MRPFMQGTEPSPRSAAEHPWSTSPLFPRSRTRRCAASPASASTARPTAPRCAEWRARSSTAAPTRRASSWRGRWRWRTGASPSSISRGRPAHGARGLRHRLQWRGVPLRRAARRAVRARARLHHPQRHRGGAAIVPRVGRGVHRARRRDVRARAVGRPPREARPGARPAGEEAPALCAAAGRVAPGRAARAGARGGGDDRPRLRLRAEGARGPRGPAAGARPRGARAVPGGRVRACPAHHPPRRLQAPGRATWRCSSDAGSGSGGTGSSRPRSRRARLPRASRRSGSSCGAWRARSRGASSPTCRWASSSPAGSTPRR